MEDQSTITLPKEEWKVLALRDKLEEYRGRLSKPIAQPSWAEEDIVDKIMIVELLLENGQVALEEVAEARKSHPKFSESWTKYDLQGDFNVIAAYCLTGGEGIRYGTGFPRQGSGIEVPVDQ